MKRAAVFVAGGAIAIMCALFVGRYLAGMSGAIDGDFRAFYCAAMAVRSGADPYFAQPLALCEAVKVQPAFLFTAPPNVAVPAPLPGYALALFVPLTLLSFPVAAFWWTMILAAALAVTIVSLRRLTALPYPLLAAALVLSEGLTSLWSGELVPIVVLALCACAWYARHRKPWAAACAALVTMIEPHVGLPACAALAIWVSATRIPLLLGGAALSGTSVALLGMARNIEYFTTVLPAHVDLERSRVLQYSLTWVLHQAGVPDTMGTTLGTASYVGLLGFGLLWSRRVARDLSDDAAVVLLPPALVLLGGTYIHIAQMCIAIPIVLLLIARVNQPYRSTLAFVLAALSVPWPNLAASPLMAVIASLVVAICLRSFITNDRMVMAAMAFTALLLVGSAISLAHVPQTTPHLAAAMPRNAVALAAVAWSHVVAHSGYVESPIFWAIKAPTWLALAALVLVAAWGTKGRQAYDSSVEVFLDPRPGADLRRVVS